MVRRHPILINPPGGGVDDLFVTELNIQPNLVPFPWDHHTRTAFGMDDAAVTNVWEVCFRDRIDYAPDVVYSSTIIVSYGRGLC